MHSNLTKEGKLKPVAQNSNGKVQDFLSDYVLLCKIFLVTIILSYKVDFITNYYIIGVNQPTACLCK